MMSMWEGKNKKDSCGFSGEKKSKREHSKLKRKFKHKSLARGCHLKGFKVLRREVPCVSDAQGVL